MTDLENFLIRIEKDIKTVRPVKKSGRQAKALEADLTLVSNAVCVLLTKVNEISGELSKMKNIISVSLNKELDEKNAEIAKMKENNVVKEIGDDKVSDLSKSIYFGLINEVVANLNQRKEQEREKFHRG